MIAIQDLPRFDVGEFDVRFIDHRTHGLVLRVSEGLVAKTPLMPEYWSHIKLFENPRKWKHKGRDYQVINVVKEEEIARDLHQNNVSVPKPEGVFRIDVVYPNSQCRLEDVPCFVMEHIEGRRITEADYGKWHNRRIAKLHREELRKARKLGYCIKDAGPHNLFYLPGERKVVIFDFALWQKVA